MASWKWKMCAKKKSDSFLCGRRLLPHPWHTGWQIQVFKITLIVGGFVPSSADGLLLTNFRKINQNAGGGKIESQPPTHSKKLNPTAVTNAAPTTELWSDISHQNISSSSKSILATLQHPSSKTHQQQQEQHDIRLQCLWLAPDDF